MYSYGLLLLVSIMGDVRLLHQQFNRMLAAKGMWVPEIPPWLLLLDKFRDAAELVEECVNADHRKRPNAIELMLRLRAMQPAATTSAIATVSTNDDEENTILAGMYEFVPDEARSVLGKGAFGTVFRARNRIDQRLVAVKRLTNLVRDDGTEDKEEMRGVKNEVKMMAAVKSEHLVKYINACFSSPYFYIVMELLASYV